MKRVFFLVIFSFLFASDYTGYLKFKNALNEIVNTDSDSVCEDNLSCSGAVYRIKNEAKSILYFLPKIGINSDSTYSVDEKLLPYLKSIKEYEKRLPNTPKLASFRKNLEVLNECDYKKCLNYTTANLLKGCKEKLDNEECSRIINAYAKNLNTVVYENKTLKQFLDDENKRLIVKMAYDLLNSNAHKEITQKCKSDVSYCEEVVNKYSKVYNYLNNENRKLLDENRKAIEIKKELEVKIENLRKKVKKAKKEFNLEEDVDKAEEQLKTFEKEFDKIKQLYNSSKFKTPTLNQEFSFLENDIKVFKNDIRVENKNQKDSLFFKLSVFIGILGGLAGLYIAAKRGVDLNEEIVTVETKADKRYSKGYRVVGVSTTKQWVIIFGLSAFVSGFGFYMLLQTLFG